MEKNKAKIYAKMFGNKVLSTKLVLEGYEKPIPFDIYDGFAICENYEGHQIVMEYPMIDVVRKTKEFSDAIIEQIGGTLKPNDITVVHSLIVFSKRYVDGVLILPAE